MGARYGLCRRHMQCAPEATSATKATLTDLRQEFARISLLDGAMEVVNQGFYDSPTILVNTETV